VNKFHLWRSVGPKSQFITSFDCHAAVCLPDDVQECLWIQEATGTAWIGLEQNMSMLLSVNRESLFMPVFAY